MTPQETTLAHPTRALSAFVSNLRYEEIPSQVVEHLKLHILDTIGVGFFGSTQPWSKIVVEYIRKTDETSQAQIWAQSSRCSAPNAALANATMCHGFELDDIHRTAVVHPGPASLPAALALAETAKGVTGKDLLTAVAAGYESSIRVGMAMGTSLILRGFHGMGINGTIAAVAASGRMLELSEKEMTEAFGIGASLAAGLMAAQFGGMTKRLHAGKAAQTGVMTAMLAQMGFTGIPNILETEYGGFLTTMSDNFDVAKITDRLGQDYRSQDVGCKPYACVASTHTALDAVRDIMNNSGPLSLEGIKSITVRMGKASKDHAGWQYSPHDVTTAQMNLQYAVAVMLLDGDAFVDQYVENRIADPKILDLARKVECVHDPSIDKLGDEYRHMTAVEVLMENGRKMEKRVEFSKGSNRNPMTRQEYISKFTRLATRVCGEDKAREITDEVLNIERMVDVSRLVELLRG